MESVQLRTARRGSPCSPCSPWAMRKNAYRQDARSRKRLASRLRAEQMRKVGLQVFRGLVHEILVNLIGDPMTQ